MRFVPNFRPVAQLQGHYPISEIEPEQGCYSATPGFVRQHCGPIACSVLDAVPAEYFEAARRAGLYPNIDVRVHRLYPGNVPAYPGLHCDANVRETYFGQPQPEHTPVSQHMICSVSTAPDGVSCTEFVTEPCEVDVSADDGPALWARVHEATKHLDRVGVPDGQLTQFDSSTLHMATPARVRGWRLFFRIAMWHRPNLGHGKLSRQEMIYLPSENVGW